jgi:hypothetical protein
MQDSALVKDVQNWHEESSRSIDSFLGLQKEVYHSFKFSEVLRTFSGLKLRRKLSKH